MLRVVLYQFSTSKQQHISKYGYLGNSKEVGLRRRTLSRGVHHCWHSSLASEPLEGGRKEGGGWRIEGAEEEDGEMEGSKKRDEKHLQLGVRFMQCA